MPLGPETRPAAAGQNVKDKHATNKTRQNHLISSLTHATTFPEQLRYHQQWGGELWRKHLQGRGYKGSDDEHRVEDVRLEGEERQAHVGEDEVLCQEVEQLKQLKGEEESAQGVR